MSVNTGAISNPLSNFCSQTLPNFFDAYFPDPNSGARPAAARSPLDSVGGQGADSPVEVVRAECPVPVRVRVTSRAGDIPIPGVKIYCGGRDSASLVGTTNAEGVAFGTGNGCDGSMVLTACYANADRRLKQEVFRIDISGIDVPAGSATGGSATNTIEKIIDAAGDGGDEDFVDSYSGADLVRVANNAVEVDVKLATLSLHVPKYVNQSYGNETVGGETFKGNALCAPSSYVMLLSYWGIDIGRNDLMSQMVKKNGNRLKSGGYPIWQTWERTPGYIAGIADDNGETGHDYTGRQFASGETIPSSEVTNAIRPKLEKGQPSVTSTVATAFGHIMLISGCVVNSSKQIQFLIIHDPYGSLITTSSKYDDGKTEGYKGNEAELNASDREGDDKGRHVYYSSAMEAAKGAYKLKSYNTMYLERSPALTKEQISQRLTPGNPQDE